MHIYLEALLALGIVAVSAALFKSRRATRELKRCLTLQEKVTDVLATASRTDDLYGPLMTAILECTGYSVACALEVDAEGKMLRCKKTVHRGGEALARFSSGTAQLVFALGSGVPGLVWQSGEMIFIRSLADEPTFARGADAAKAGLTNVLAVPVSNGGKVVAVLEFFGSSDTGCPSVSLRTTFAKTAEQVGRFIGRADSQSAIYESETELRTVIDTAPDGIICVSEAGVIESVNAAAARLLGYKPEELQGNSLMTFLPASYKEAFGSALNFYFRSVAQQLVGRIVEGTAQRKDGTTFPMELAVSRLVVGEKEKYTGIVRDITDRKDMEKRVSEFYSTVSHELRSPLASIRGSLGLIEGGAIGPVPEEVFELVQIAKRNCDRLIRLINDILDAKKIEAGKLELVATRLNPFELVSAAVEGMRSVAAENRVVLFVRPIEAPCMVLGDADRIVQVLTNLLSNAIKYSPPGSQVDVYVSPAINGDQYVRFSVTDKGPGIHSDQLAKLFSEFQQLDASDSRPKGGTGLGLAISKSIVEHMDGQIGVDNSPGSGATFWFELPSTGPGAQTSFVNRASDERANA